MFSSSQLFVILFIFYQGPKMIVGIDSLYSFTTEDVWLSMPDSIRLSATLTIPVPKQNHEKFPVLLEYKPYRKDDSFYNCNQQSIHYLVRRGFIVSKLTTNKAILLIFLFSGG